MNNCSQIFPGFFYSDCYMILVTLWTLGWMNHTAQWCGLKFKHWHQTWDNFGISWNNKLTLNVPYHKSPQKYVNWHLTFCLDGFWIFWIFFFSLLPPLLFGSLAISGSKVLITNEASRLWEGAYGLTKVSIRWVGELWLDRMGFLGDQGFLV